MLMKRSSLLERAWDRETPVICEGWQSMAGLLGDQILIMGSGKWLVEGRDGHFFEVYEKGKELWILN